MPSKEDIHTAYGHAFHLLRAWFARGGGRSGSVSVNKYGASASLHNGSLDDLPEVDDLRVKAGTGEGGRRTLSASWEERVPGNQAIRVSVSLFINK